MSYLRKRTQYELSQWVNSLPLDAAKDFELALPSLVPIRKRRRTRRAVSQRVSRKERRALSTRMRPETATTEKSPLEIAVSDERTLWLLDTLGRRTDYFEDISIKNGRVYLTLGGVELLKQAHRLVSERLEREPEESPSEFFDTEAELKVDGIVFALPPHKNEHWFCRAAFEYSPKEPIDWSLLYEEMVGNSVREQTGTKESWRKVYDTMEAINKRIKLRGLGELFIWREKTVRRLR